MNNNTIITTINQIRNDHRDVSNKIARMERTLSNLDQRMTDLVTTLSPLFPRSTDAFNSSQEIGLAVSVVEQ